MPYQSVDVVAKQVPMELKMTLKRALEVSPELKRMYDSDPQVTELIDTALKVEGMPRHASTHAAGVVITPEPTDYYLPLATNDGLPVTQFNMTEIEELGLLKMDFLGLRTLTVIRDAEAAIQKKDPSFSIRKLDYDDAAVGDVEDMGQLWRFIADLIRLVAVAQVGRDGVHRAGAVKTDKSDDIFKVLRLQTHEDLFHT